MATSTVTAAQSLHRAYVKSLYKRYLTNALNWAVQRDVWRQQALQIRAEFERHKNESDPAVIAKVLGEAEAKLAAKLHPDPYISAKFPGGTGWERNMPPPQNAFNKFISEEHHDHHHDAEAVEEMDLLLPQDKEKFGDKYRLSRGAIAALQQLTSGAQGMHAALESITTESEAKKSAWAQKIEELKKQGVDVSEIDTDAFGRKFSEYSDADKETLLENWRGMVESLELQRREVIEQEYSNKRDTEDGVWR
ncbi:hypothetical protein CPB86DRAFT_515910 [Serendipita vermifera]|nr:hypothetical protein CPB86DRAFT_515910 [Serendipita vermifera]